MASTQELILKLSADGGNLKSTMSQVRSEVQQTATRIKQSKLDVDGLGGSFKNLSASASALGGPVGQAAGQISSLGSAAAGASTGAGAFGLAIAGAGIAAAGAVAGFISAGKAIFDLAKNASDYAGKLFDLSKQTNFSVETLSTLSLAAETSGASIESISGSLGIFQTNMVKAAEGQKDMSRLFKELKIDTSNNEVAFRQAAKALYDMGEGERQSAAAKQLFGRAGREVLGLIKETNGDLDLAAEKYADLGLAISTQAAVAADKFEEALTNLNRQLTAVSNNIGFAVMPAMIAFFEDISQMLTGSKDSWASWADGIALAVIRAEATIEAFVQFLASKGTLDFFSLLETNEQALRKRAGSLKADFAIEAMISQTTRLAGRTLGGGGGGGGGGGAGKATKPKKTDEEREAEQAAAKLKKEEEQRIAFVLEYNQKNKDLTETLKGVNVTTQEYIVTQSIQNGLLAAGTDGLQKEALALAKANDALTAQVATLKEIQSIDPEKMQKLLFGMDLREQQAATLGDSGRKYPDKLTALGTPPDFGLWKGFFDSMESGFQSFSEVGIEAFNSVTEAIGESVAAWALHGESLGRALQKAFAVALAQFAAEALVQSLRHAAYALGSLAFGDIAGATKHGIAAAKWAGVAALAAAGARLVAPAAVASTGGGAAGGGGGGGGAAGGTSSGKQTINAPRDVVQVVHRIELGPGLVEKEVIKSVRYNSTGMNGALNQGAR